jgi:CRP/FNR family cyclic AMP-dependent transcriptional regulator
MANCSTYSFEALMRAVTFKAGDPVINEGDAGETAFYILDGSVEVSIGLGNKERTVGTLKAGEVFGEMSLIVPGPRSATVRASTDVKCLETSYEEFIAAIKSDPTYAVEFMKTLVLRLRQMNAMMESLGPRRRGFRELVHDLRKSLGRRERDPEKAARFWRMIW